MQCHLSYRITTPQTTNFTFIILTPSYMPLMNQDLGFVALKRIVTRVLLRTRVLRGKVTFVEGF